MSQIEQIPEQHPSSSPIPSSEPIEAQIQGYADGQTLTKPMKWRDYLFTQTNEHFDSISREDIDQLNMLQYKIALYPIVTFLTLTGIKKATEFVRIPELLRNPLVQPNMNVQRGKHFRSFLGKNILLLACTTSLIGGYAVYEVNKYYMYVKYKSLVNVYLDSCERDYLQSLQQEGRQVDLVLGAKREPSTKLDE